MCWRHPSPQRLSEVECFIHGLFVVCHCQLHVIQQHLGSKVHNTLSTNLAVM